MCVLESRVRPVAGECLNEAVCLELVGSFGQHEMSNLGFPDCELSLESHQHFIPPHVVPALTVLSPFFGFLKPSDTAEHFHIS